MGGCIGWFLGGLDGLIWTLIIFMVIDYLTGILRAIYKKQVSSQLCWRGAVKKVLTLVLVGVSHSIDAHIIGGGTFVRDAVLVFFIGGEGISLLENSAAIGVKWPDKLKAILVQLHGRDEENEHNPKTKP